MAHGRCRRQRWIAEGTSDSIRYAQLSTAVPRLESSPAQTIAPKVSPWNGASGASITEAGTPKTVAFDGSLIAQ
jgi:hypothetical protein